MSQRYEKLKALLPNLRCAAGLGGTARGPAKARPGAVRPTGRSPRRWAAAAVRRAATGPDSATLDSFIVANTPSHEMKLLWSMDKRATQQRHIVFQEEDAASCIGTMLPR